MDQTSQFSSKLVPLSLNEFGTHLIKSSIDDNKNLSTIDKSNYLRNLLESNGYSTIVGLSLINKLIKIVRYLLLPDHITKHKLNKYI